MGTFGRWRVLAVILVLSAGLAGCELQVAGAIPRPAGPPGPPASKPSHLIVVIEENHSFEQIIGSPSAPFINQLAAAGTLLTNYHAITHPSLPNYIALLSGRTGRIRSDCPRCTISGPTLVDQLEAGHISWAAYLEGLPRPCSTVAASGAYTEAVDPFIHATRVREFPSRCDRVLPYSQFGPDLAAGRLPTVAFVVPNLLDDMHSGPVPVADAWLHRFIDELKANQVWRQDTRVVVTFDEGARDDVRACCDGLGRGGLIPTIIAGPRIPRGRDPTPYTHYALLRSIEAAFGLPFLDHARGPGVATIPAVATGAARGPLWLPASRTGPVALTATVPTPVERLGRGSAT